MEVVKSLLQPPITEILRYTQDDKSALLRQTQPYTPIGNPSDELYSHCCFVDTMKPVLKSSYIFTMSVIENI